MLGRTHCAGAHGLEGYVIAVEADIGPGEPSLKVVGQTEGPLVVAAERVRAALEHCGILLPTRAQLIHITPAERRKHGRGLDLAIACALLIAHGVLPPSALDGMLAWGELAPDGRVLAVPGTLLAAATARRQGFRVLALAVTSEAEAAPMSDLDLLLVPDLASLVAHLRGEASLPRGPARASLLDDPQTSIADVPERPSLSSLALELMLAGGHHLLVLTRSLLLNERELAVQLGPLALADAIELTTIHDLLTPTRLLRAPCVRRPSIHASSNELFGSAHSIHPGEVSLADHGVLVLDDLHQLAHQATLRQVLEDRSITHDGAHFPARFRLLATSPCTSDLAPSLLDRVDLVVRAGTIPIDPTAAERIELARARQRSRLAATPWSCNAEIPRFGEAIHSLCRAADRRPDPRVARVARTIADLDLDRDPAEPLDADLLALAERLALEAR